MHHCGFIHFAYWARVSWWRHNYFINGIKLLGTDWDECMMDGCHFNDLGYYRFAENLNKYIKF